MQQILLNYLYVAVLPLFFGALLSYYAIERQLKVQTAFMVEHRGDPQRDHERLNGLWEMGVRHYPILGTAPDTKETQLHAAKVFYASSNIEQWQVEQIRRFKPMVIVGHDLKGEYGNGGHKTIKNRENQINHLTFHYTMHNA